MQVGFDENQDFINRITKIVEANYSNEKFGVSGLAREVGMSRSNIHRRLKAINNQSPSSFIRTIRLEKAKDMILRTDLSASEVAYKVGFSSPAYFNHCYHKHFGYPPGETKKHNLAGTTNSVNQSKLQPPPKNKPGIVPNKKLLFTITGTILLLLVAYLFYNVFLIKSPVEKSVIVIPFKNLSDDNNNQYFVDGITEDILNHLTKISDLKVLSRTSTEQFRESSLSPPEIAKQMNVNYILEGSIRRQGDRVRISVQLIDAKNDKHLSSENYDRQIKDIFAVQSDIAKNVADKLQAILTPEEIQNIEKQHTVNPEAYNYYLMGRYFWNRRNEVSQQKSAAYFQKAIETDPNYALAYAGLADTYYARTFVGLLPRESGYKKAYEMAEHALEIDENLPEAYAVLGIVTYYGYWEWEKARGLFERALQIDGDCMVALLYYANLLSILGENEEARKYINHAIEVEPYFSILHAISGTIYRDVRKRRESIQAYKRCSEISPDHKGSYYNIFTNYLELDVKDSAAVYLQKYLNINPKYQNYQKEMMNSYEKSGIEGVLTFMVKVNLEEAEKEFYTLAGLYARLGQKEEALFYLEKTVEKKFRAVPRTIVSPVYENLHSEPRFLALVDTMGLMPYFKK